MTNLRRVSAGIGCVAVLAGCGSSGDERPAARPAATVAPGTPAELDIHLDQDARSSYIEGAVTHVELRALRGAGSFLAQPVVRFRGSLADTRIRRRLPPGIYRVRAWQRACGGSCDNLSKPIDRCTARFAMPDRGSKTLTIAVAPGEPCRVSAR